MNDRAESNPSKDRGRQARRGAPGVTRAAVLRTARELFGRHGYDGTSIRNITRRAGANLGAVTYHFGTKRKLYHAVLASVFDPLAARVAAAAGDRPGVPLDRIEAVVRGFLAYQTANRDLPSLMLHELILSRPASAPIRRTMERVFSQIAGLIEAGQADGSIVAGAPTLLTMSILAQPIYVSVARQRLREVFGVDLSDQAVHAQVADHMVQFIRRSLSTSGRES